jgi:hypothetical protein
MEMKIELFYKMIDTFFWLLCEKQISTWNIPADEIHDGDQFPAAEATSGYYAKSLLRPVARNGIKSCSR